MVPASACFFDCEKLCNECCKIYFLFLPAPTHSGYPFSCPLFPHLLGVSFIKTLDSTIKTAFNHENSKFKFFPRLHFNQCCFATEKEPSESPNLQEEVCSFSYSPNEGLLVWTPTPLEFPIELPTGCKDPPTLQNFQELSMVEVCIFPGTMHCARGGGRGKFLICDFIFEWLSER